MNKNIVKILVIAGLLALLTSCTKTEQFNLSDNDVGYNTTAAPTTQGYVYQTEQVDISLYESNVETLPPSSSNFTEDITNAPQTDIPQQTDAVVTVTQPIQQPTTEKTYEKTGEMAFSDNADNKYIKAIVTKYGVNPENLVALYTVPDNDGNIVLEFDGSKDSNGKLIRDESSLISIYSIDKNLNSKRASETHSLNEYSYGEMKVMFMTTTKYIMPEFKNELNG
ncbi:MAG: hypothetical protein IJ025_09505 [Clostridia bacterium]|nr:hypothetical protein [Clostridia bacterium]